MNIAAELNNSILTVFTEGATWESLTTLFDKEKVKVERIVYMEEDPVFHDTITTGTGEPETHRRLAFCKDILTVGTLKRKLAEAGFGEPYEVRLSSSTGLFTIEKIYTEAFTVSFTDFQKNQSFLRWLIKSVPSFEADNFVKKLLAGGRYNTRAFAEYSAFADLTRFTEHRCELWQKLIIKEYEAGLLLGTARCEVCTPNQAE